MALLWLLVAVGLAVAEVFTGTFVLIMLAAGGLAAAATAALMSDPAVAASASTTPTVVSLTFDDERASQGVVGRLLAEHHMQGTFYIISRRVNVDGMNPKTLTWAQIHELAQQGNEIGAHTQTHPHLSTLAPAAQKTQICGSARDLLAQGFHVLSFAYPYGQYTQTTESIVKGCGFASGRSAWGGAETVPPADRYGLRTLASAGASTSLAALESEVTHATGGQWLQYVFHDIGDPYPGGDQYRISTADFTAFLDWLERQRRQGTIVIKTVGAVLH